MLWEQKAPDVAFWTSARPFVWRGSVLVGHGEGGIFAYDLSDGSLRWSHDLGGEIRVFGSHGDYLFVGTIGGTLSALTVGEAQ